MTKTTAYHACPCCAQAAAPVGSILGDPVTEYQLRQFVRHHACPRRLRWLLWKWRHRKALR